MSLKLKRKKNKIFRANLRKMNKVEVTAVPVLIAVVAFVTFRFLFYIKNYNF